MIVVVVFRFEEDEESGDWSDSGVGDGDGDTLCYLFLTMNKPSIQAKQTNFFAFLGVIPFLKF